MQESKARNHNLKRFFSICAVAFLIFTIVMVAEAVGPNALRSGFEDIILPPNDDGSTANVDIGFTIDFFGTSYSSLYVNNNGNITFDDDMWDYTPFNLYTAGRVIIAPFFADVDTSSAGDPVSYQLYAMGGRIPWMGIRLSGPPGKMLITTRAPPVIPIGTISR